MARRAEQGSLTQYLWLKSWTSSASAAVAKFSSPEAWWAVNEKGCAFVVGSAGEGGGAEVGLMGGPAALGERGRHHVDG